MELKDKVALVTGASRGIGREIVVQLVKQGAKIAVNYKESDKDAQTVVRYCKEHGVDAVAIKADVSDRRQCQELIEKTIQYFGTIDILINNAGVAVYKPFEQTGLGTIAQMIDTNLSGLMYLTHEALQTMKANDSGIIVNISSGAGKTGFPGLVAYCATKFGVVGFTEALGKELHETGIETYCVCPGSVDTDMYHGLFPGSDAAELIPPDKIARMVVALCTGKKKLKNGGSVDVFS